jgi:hypothetical protein
MVEDDPRLVGALEEFLGEIESGGRPDRQLYLARYADIAPTLAACLDSVEMVSSAAPQFRFFAPLRTSRLPANSLAPCAN